MEVTVSLIIACYNEEEHLKDSLQKTFEVMDYSRFSYEVIFVDDCSQDRTRELIDEIINENKDREIRKIFHEKNTGRGGAVTDGIRASRGEIVGFFDIDLEVSAHYILPCIQTLLNGYDVATAWRIYKFNLSSLDRYIMSRGYSLLVRSMLGVDFKDTETGFKFFRKERILTVLEKTSDRGWFWDTEIMMYSKLAGLKITEIPCLFVRRTDKKSTVNSMRDSIDYLRKLLRFRRKMNREKGS